MNATQFIQQHGVDKAREVVSKHAECYMPEVFKYWSEQLHDYVLAPKYAASLVSDLKRLVESIDHIGDVNDMGDDTHIENHVSPNCKKFEEQVGNNETK